uniref:F-box associated beta-propeller type 1 domain-containing protein n=2 Tax=Brassica oleracea TaxID=3712 RepID=A0A3P6FMP7_BRAOL|nr:unnamed protein product [Brassica oleracea]
MEESLEGIFNMVQVNPVRRRCSAQVMQLGVDPHKRRYSLGLASQQAARSTCKKWNSLYKDESFTKNQRGKAAYDNMVVMDSCPRCPNFVALWALMREAEYTGLNEAPSKPGTFSRLTRPAKSTLRVCLVRVDLKGVHNNKDGLVEISTKLMGQQNRVKVHREFMVCDGLLLCFRKNGNPLIWNPYLGQVRTVEYEMYDFKSDSWRDLAVTCDWIIEDYREGFSLKGNNYFVAERKKELVEMGEYLVCFDFTRDSVTLSPVREEQLAVLLYSADRYEVEIRITTKIEANEMTWINFLKVDVKPFTGIIWECLRFGIGSFLVDEKKKVALIWDNYCNQAYVTGEDNYFKQVAPGGSTYLPRVFSYVPSLVQIQKGPEQAGGKRKVRY